MRESIGGAMMLRIFLIVIVLFVAFLSISVSYAKAFRIKNGVIDIIEKYQGVNDTSIPIIKSFLSSWRYTCKSNNYNSVTQFVLMDNDPEGFGLNGDYIGFKENSNSKFTVIGNSNTSSNSDIIDRKYNIQVCINWDIPVIGFNGSWIIRGKTDLIEDVFIS